ncbi:MAG: 50S ribosomal protein L25/general stress protein Ctc [Desulfobacterales bacterium]|nr:50S ribosomal protein L25/general stress protein Ctc [Desulfobacterales bacterium]
MEQLELNATVRTGVGNGPARRLRQQGLIPAVLYGRAVAPVMLTVNGRDFERAVQKGSVRRTIVSLNLQNGAGTARTAIIKELQRHPVNGQFLHVDFYEIAMDRKLKVMVPVVTKGKAKGEEFGGMLQIIEREIEVLCLPREIPGQIEVDVTELGVGDTLHVNDIALPAGVERAPGDNYTVLTVVSQKAEAAPAAAEAEAAEGEAAEKPAEAATTGE